MKKTLILLLTLFTQLTFSQVAVNTDGSSANTSAMLDVKSSNKGLLIPRMTSAQRNAISSPATGLLVFDTDENNFFFYNGINWVLLKSGIVNWNLDSINLTVADTNYRVGVGTTTPSGRFEVATVKHYGTYGSDVCSGGTVSASSQYQTYTPDRAFDDQTTTEWLSDNSLPGYLQYDFGEGNNKRIAKYRIYYEHLSSYDHSPNDWTFEASNDGSTWTTLDTQTGQGWHGNGWKEYTFSNTTKYRYYRIYITDNAGSSDNYVQINETEMMEENLSNNTTLFVNDNKVGIGTSSPSATLDISGTMKLADGNEGAGKVLVSDASGNAGWADGATVNGGGWTVNGNYISETGDSVGIGTSSPDARLTVNGRISQTGTGYSVFLGEGAGKNDDLNNNMNTFVGYASGKENISGNYNTAIGEEALYKNTNGYHNTAVGAQALYNNYLSSSWGWYGSKNTAVGYKALYYNVSGQENTAVGHEALMNNLSGFYNCAFGMEALLNNKGSYNVAMGIQAAYYDSTGEANTAIGPSALCYNKTGNNNTALGNWAGPSSSSTGLDNTTAIGNGASVTASNTIHIGNTSVTEIAGQVGWSTYSDKRFKKTVRKNVPGLSFIMKLNPVTYHWDIDKLNRFLNVREDKSESFIKAKERQESIEYTGFLAQEVEKAAQETGYDFSGVVPPQNNNSVYSIRYAEFVVPLVKAVQEQEQKIEQQQKTIDDLKKQLAVMKEMMKNRNN